jgi:hypothetical protein
MHDQASYFFILISTGLSAAVAYLFDVPPQILWIAAIGSAAGVAITRATSPFYGFLWILGGTMVTGWSLPVAVELWPTFPEKSVAAIGAMILIGFRHKILEKTPMLIDNAFETFSALLRWRPGAKQPKAGDPE